jgi:hypothetical protein
MNGLGVNAGYKYSTVVIVTALLLITGIACGVWHLTGRSFNFHGLFLFTVLFKMRRKVRERLNLPGGRLEDGCCLFSASRVC